MQRPNSVKFFVVVLFAGLLLAGCATPSTVVSRKQERSAAYAALPPEMKAAVDQGQLKAGMNMDAVYIAWGPPGQVLNGGNEGGETTTWIYYGGYVEEVRYWGHRSVHYDYDPRTYQRAQVVFVNGLVSQWQTFPPPAN
ncbi:MAG TPA: hypothetical protein VFC07_09650 [Verrucomicrobiae bacterium]|nr:hypothetical protein [Verrucomicrobiae bacterium]